MKYWIVYYLVVEKKKAVFSEKIAKNRFWSPSLSWRSGASGNENEYNLFCENWVLNTFSFNNFFEKSNILGKMGKRIFGGHDHFLKGVILH